MTVPAWLPGDCASWTTDPQYRAADGCNWSLLKKMDDSPLAYRYHRDNPDADGDTYSRMALRAAHCVVLEPHKFDDDFVVFEGARRGKAWAAFKDDNVGRTIIRDTEKAQIDAVAAAIAAHPVASALLAACEWKEIPLRWTDPTTGLVCKGKLDALGNRVPISPCVWSVVDMKQVASVQPRALASMAAKHRWHGQQGHYSSGVEVLSGEPCDGFIIAVESKAPHDVAVVRFDPASDLFAGITLRDRLLARLSECEKAGEWPGAMPELADIGLPSWVWPDEVDLDVYMEEHHQEPK